MSTTIKSMIVRNVDSEYQNWSVFKRVTLICSFTRVYEYIITLSLNRVCRNRFSSCIYWYILIDPKMCLVYTKATRWAMRWALDGPLWWLRALRDKDMGILYSYIHLKLVKISFLIVWSGRVWFGTDNLFSS